MNALADEKAKFSPEELAQHAVVRELLWLFYPQRPDDVPSEDGVADRAATAIIEALSRKRRAVMG
jgi:hypothetical protein